MHRAVRNVLSSAVAMIGLTSASATATSVSWNGLFSGSWTTGANWGAFAEPAAGDTATFGTAATTFQPNINLDASRTIAGFTVTGTPNFNFTRSGLVGLDVSNSTSFQSGDSSTTSFGGVYLTTSTLDVYVTARVNFNAGSAITVLTGSGSAGTAQTTLNASLLSVSDTHAMYNTSTLSLNNGSDAMMGSLFMDDSSALNVNSGSLTLHNNSTMNGGTLTVGSSGTLNINAGKSLTLNNSGTKLQVNTGLGLPAGATFNVNSGADIAGSTYIDVGNGNAGTLNLSGAGTTLTTAGVTASDWGRGISGAGAVSLSNSAQANVQTLRIGTSGGAASVSVLSGSKLLASGTLNMGGGSTQRLVGMDINAGTLEVIGNANFDDKADVNLQGGSAVFHADVTFLPGSRLDWTGGTVNTTNIFFNVQGATVARGPSVSTELSNGSALNVTAGGQFTGSSYFDLARLGSGGALVVDGAGSLFTAGGTSDWGSGGGHLAFAQVANNAVANLANLRFGTSHAAASLNLLSGGKLTASGAFEAGGGATVRDVGINVGGGTLETGSVATFNDQAAVTLSSGAINFNGDTTFNAGSAFSWTGGSLNVASGKTLTLNHMTLTRNTTGGQLTSGATLRLLDGGVFNSNSFYDITTGTLLIDGANSILLAGGTAFTDWAGINGNSANVTLSNGGRTNFNGAGIRMSLAGGTTTLNINTGGLLAAASVQTGGITSTVNITVNSPNAAAIDSSGEVRLKQGTTLTMTAGYLTAAGPLSLQDDARILMSTTPNAAVIGCESLSFAGTGKIDLGRGVIVINFQGMPPLDSTRGYIQSGYNGGSWTGNGITSSFAQANSKYAIGYSANVINVTVFGDADLSQTVNFDDLLTLAQNYGGVNKYWQQGDFTYDGVVNFDDLLKLAQNYGLSALTGVQTGLVGDSFSSDFALAMSMVPEPTTLAGLAFAGLTVSRKRRV